MSTEPKGARRLRAADVAAYLAGYGWEDVAALADRAGGADAALVREPLRVLLRACAEEAALSTFGRLGLRWDVLRLLGNLRRLAEEEARCPAIQQEEIAAPLVITGLPRSGTTFLHRLLAADPSAVAPRVWQTIHPYPDPRARRDDRIERVERMLRRFTRFAPTLRNIHPLDGNSPQECTEITAQVFQSLRFETMYNVPSYKAWLAAHGHETAYRFHRRFLQHLQYQGHRGRWVLKCPDHVFALEALHTVYPDARVVFLHRDPLRVLPSVAHLTEVLRAPFTRVLDRRAIGRTVVDDWARGADIMVREACAPLFPPEQTLHVRYRDLVQRPLDTVKRLYGHFGLPLKDAALEAMQRLLAAAPRGGYGANRYSFADYGIVPEDVRARFAAYVGLFGVPPEGETAPSARGMQTRPAHAGP